MRFFYPRWRLLLIAICWLVFWFEPTFARGSEVYQSLPRQSRADSSRSSKEKKSPSGAMLRSLLFPGWGQWYNNQKIKAALVLAAQGTLVGLAVHYNNRAKENVADSADYEKFIDKRNQTFWFMGGVTLLSMLDAYIDAYLYDFDVGPELELRAGLIENRSMSVIGVSIRARF
jgi:hypothetical protein